ncbi:hypothetical protein LZ31DRAFT_314852 [Colletotrichum somersetense]|nr:hypothetical protein LZ31DRAFT_314852 [Colletotrichum somersetense]
MSRICFMGNLGVEKKHHLRATLYEKGPRVYRKHVIHDRKLDLLNKKIQTSSSLSIFAFCILHSLGWLSVPAQHARGNWHP